MDPSLRWDDRLHVIPSLRWDDRLHVNPAFTGMTGRLSSQRRLGSISSILRRASSSYKFSLLSPKEKPTESKYRAISNIS
jgi:hypothetical protein